MSNRVNSERYNYYHDIFSLQGPALHFFSSACRILPLSASVTAILPLSTSVALMSNTLEPTSTFSLTCAVSMPVSNDGGLSFTSPTSTVIRCLAETGRQNEFLKSVLVVKVFFSGEILKCDIEFSFLDILLAGTSNDFPGS